MQALGEGCPKAGGGKGRKNRFEVLDRLSRLKAGLSAGQRNDWPWFKEAWDGAMVTQHQAQWASIFAGWVQSILDDRRGNAFSSYVYNETLRVFQNTAAVQLPGA